MQALPGITVLPLLPSRPCSLLLLPRSLRAHQAPDSGSTESRRMARKFPTQDMRLVLGDVTRLTGCLVDGDVTCPGDVSCL